MGGVGAMDWPHSAAWEFWSFPTILAIAAASVVLLTACKFSFGGRGSKGRRLPPGPRPWPIIGNFKLGMRGASKESQQQRLLELAKEYGPIFSQRFGFLVVIVVTTSGYAEEILKTHDAVFASRRPNTYSRILGFGSQSIGHAPYGPHWRHIRKVLTLELLTLKRVQEFQELRKTETLRTLQAIIDESEDGKAVGVRQHCRDLTRNNITQMMISKDYFGPNSGASTMKGGEEYIKTMEQVVKMMSMVVLEDIFPFLGPLDLYGAKKKMNEARKEVDRVLDRIIEEHRQKLRLNEGAVVDSDRLDVISAMLTRPAGDGEKPLSDDQIKAVLQSIFIGGTETSSRTLEWTLMELLKNPPILKKAQNEIDSVVGQDRLVEESDIPQLEYLQAIVKESFRLHPVAPVLFPHLSMEDCQVGEFFIPKNSMVIVHAAAISKDPAVWDRPLDFYPERFLGSTTDLHGHHFDFLPFGSGRRMCPGKSLGLLLVQYALAMFLQAADWKLSQGMKPSDVDFSTNATPFEVLATPRLPVAVIQSGQKPGPA